MADGESGQPVEPGADGIADRGAWAGTVAELARVYGCSVKHVQEQIGKGAPAKGPRGYDLFAWGEWWRTAGRFQRLGGRSADPAGEVGEDVEGENWAVRKDRASALLAEQKLRDLMGVYCSREDVERAAARNFATVRLILETLAMRVAALVPVECQMNVMIAVDETVRATLDTLRAALERWADKEGRPIVDAADGMLRAVGAAEERIVAAAPARSRERIRAAVRICVAEIRARAAEAAAG